MGFKKFVYLHSQACGSGKAQAFGSNTKRLFDLIQLAFHPYKIQLNRNCNFYS